MPIWDNLRADWGAVPSTNPVVVPWASRTGFMTHWYGGVVTVVSHLDCLKLVKSIQRDHMTDPAKLWADIGYNGLVCQHALAIEGRGLAYQGAHCPGFNVSDYGVEFMLGVGQHPTPAMFNRMRDLMLVCEAQSGKTLAKRGHRDGVPTQCPGDEIYAWTKAGMEYVDEMTPEQSTQALASLARIETGIGQLSTSITNNNTDAKTRDAALLKAITDLNATITALPGQIADAVAAKGISMQIEYVPKP